MTQVIREESNRRVRECGYPVSTGHVTSGIPRLDAMLAGKRYWEGRSILVSGTAGSGK